MKNTCVYCKKEIIQQKRPINDKDYSKVYISSEHIIQNALGGRIESEDICCDRCNYHINNIVDKKFNNIFAPIVAQISCMKKSNNSKSNPGYSGYALYGEGNSYEIIKADIIKNSKIKSSREFVEKEKKRSTEKLDERIKNSYKNMIPLFYDFKLDNKVFKQGLIKIAYNYAIKSGLDEKIFSKICRVTLGEESGELVNVDFDTKVIPFVAGNTFDEYIELETEYVPFHNLILFKFCNQIWCYIDLFNTFQYYVLLCEKMEGAFSEIYEVYNKDFQYIQKDMNFEKCYEDFVLNNMPKNIDEALIDKDIQDFYMDEMHLKPYYKIYNMIQKYNDTKYKFILYPSWIVQAAKQEIIEIREYTINKFLRLVAYLNSDKYIVDIEKLKYLHNDDLKKLTKLHNSSMGLEE